MVKLSIKGTGYHNVKILMDDKEVIPISELELILVAGEPIKAKLTVFVEDLDLEVDPVFLELIKKDKKELRR